MPSQPTPWHTYLTLDLLTQVLSRTLFNPFLATLLPLCLRALATPYSAPSFIVTFLFTASVVLYHLLDIYNRRIAYGSPRKIRWEDEVVVITGGVGGLGGCLAEIFALRGVGVGVLDIRVGGKGKGEGECEVMEGEEKEGIRYWRCDVAGSEDHLGMVWGEVVKELGTPTVLINNAAVVHAKPLLDQGRREMEEVFAVNTLSHYSLSKLCIRGLLDKRKGGTLVTVSSVLAHLGASHLSAYTASKAALLAYHASLSTELAITAPNIKTVLVAPGQLDTQLFGNVKLRGWWRNFLGPVVPAAQVAVKIVEVVDRGEGGVVSEPVYARWIAWLGVLPVGLQRVVRGWSGIDDAFGGGLKPPAPALDGESSDSDSDGDASSELTMDGVSFNNGSDEDDNPRVRAAGSGTASK